MDSNLRGKNYRFPQYIAVLRLRDDKANYFSIKYLAITVTTSCTVEVDQPSGLAYVLEVNRATGSTHHRKLFICVHHKDRSIHIERLLPGSQCSTRMR